MKNSGIIILLSAIILNGSNLRLTAKGQSGKNREQQLMQTKLPKLLSVMTLSALKKAIQQLI